MASISEEEEVLEAAVGGIPKVAEVVASIPEKARAKALDAVKSTYRQTMLDLGYEEGPAEGWVSAMMLRLQAEVTEQETSKQRPTEACLVPAESEPDDNVIEIGEARKQ
jgi:Mg/Co/Ni transporter MgtE